MAVIVGAGPSGLLLAHFLLSHATKNDHVSTLLPLQIFESRDDPRTPLPLYKNRQYVVGLSARGRDAVSKVNGLWELVEKVGVPSSQFVLHVGGRELALKRDPGKPSLLVNQRSLAAVLVTELQRRYTEQQVKVSYGTPCVSVNFTSHTATFASERERTVVPYDLLVGADGSRSVVRQAFIPERGFDYEQVNVPYTFKVLQAERPRELSNDAVHAFRVSREDSSSNVTLNFSCFPTPEDKMSVLLSWSPETTPTELLNIQSPNELRGYIEKYMPPLKVSLESAEAFISQKPTSSMQVRCNRFYDERGKAVLVGDAAHAMSNALGQGCNSSLKDVETLAEMILQADGDMVGALRRYSEIQVREDDAAAYLSKNAFPESKWLRPVYLAGNVVSSLLTKTPLSAVIPPSIQSLCSETLIPYSEIVRRNKLWLKTVELTNLL